MEVCIKRRMFLDSAFYQANLNNQRKNFKHAETRRHTAIHFSEDENSDSPQEHECLLIAATLSGR
jgi:hypothetical protein